MIFRLIVLIGFILRVSVCTSDSPGAHGCAAIAVEIIDGSHVADDYPVGEIGNAMIVGIVEIVNRRLPRIIGVSLAGAGLFDVQLFDGESVWAGHCDVIRITVGTESAETGRMVSGRKFDAVDVACYYDVVAVGVFVCHDAGVIAGDGHVAQDGQRRVVVIRSDESLGAVGRLGGLHIVNAAVDEHVLKPALRRKFQVDPANLWIVIGPDIEVANDHVNGGKIEVERAAGGRDDGRA